ncbi:MAG: response regulator [Proteobacteria bacterium]|nr:response regulator [Pseudomonadota bacterium]MBU1641636.1 response regulator [Pseudomonadota bacterium]
MRPERPLVFIVDDVAENIQVALSHLSQLNCDFAYATSGEQALERIWMARPQLILMDVVMPGIDGYETVKQLKQEKSTASIPVIFLTARNEPEDIAKGFDCGGVDYITKPFSGQELRARVSTRLEIAAYRENLEEQVIERTKETELLKDVVIEAMGELAEYRDPETGGHIKRTQYYVRELAQKLASLDKFKDELRPDHIRLLFKSAPLHDIGKVAIRDTILLKPGKLTSEEFEVMKKHTTFGESVIKKLEKKIGESSFLHYAKEIACSHHERFDGTGYPRGLAGEETPLSGRIMAIADVYDALISKRVYKEAFAHDKAVAIMAEGRGSHFDAAIFDAFTELGADFQTIAERFKD